MEQLMQPARTSIKPAAAEAEIAQIRIVSWMQRRGSTAGMARHPTGRSGNASEILPMQTQRYNFEAHPRRESGGIGRRTRLRIWRGNPWGFESPLSHQALARSLAGLGISPARSRFAHARKAAQVRVPPFAPTTYSLFRFLPRFRLHLACRWLWRFFS